MCPRQATGYANIKKLCSLGLNYLSCSFMGRALARNSHRTTAAGAHLPHFAKAMWGRPESTALHSDKGLDVLSSTSACFVSRAPCISGHLHALASRSGEKSGLEFQKANFLKAAFGLPLVFAKEGNEGNTCQKSPDMCGVGNSTSSWVRRNRGLVEKL